MISQCNDIPLKITFHRLRLSSPITESPPQSPDKIVDFCGKDGLADDGNLEVLGHDGLDQGGGGGGGGAGHCRQRRALSQLASQRQPGVVSKVNDTS